MAASDHGGMGRVVSRLLGAYERLMAGLGAVLIAVIVITMGVQVFCRYVLNDSLIWAEELCAYMLVLLSFLLLGVAFRRGEMMNVELLMGMLPPRVRAAANVPVCLAMAAFLVVLSYYAYKFALLNRTASIPALDFIASAIVGETRTVVVSRFWLYLTVPIGFMLLVLHLLAAAVQNALIALGVASPGHAAADNLADVAAEPR